MIHYLFPTAIFTDKNKELIVPCNELFKKCLTWNSTPDGFQTTLAEYSPQQAVVLWDPSNEPETLQLVEFIKQSVYKFLEENSQQTTYEVSVPNIWFNQMQSGNYHKIHTHYGYTFSGCYYVSCPEESSQIMLYDHIYDGFFHVVNRVKEFTPGNSHSWWIPVDTGTIILFPSYLKHSVLPAEFEGLRKSIAFDVVLRPIPTKE